MRIISFFLLLSLTNADAQTIDTVKGAKAWKNTYLQTDVYGKMNNGHYYNIGFVNLYDSNGKMKGIQVVRLDLTTGNVIHKILPGAWPADLFANAFDSLGNVYFGFNSNNRKIWKFNMKGDTIICQNLENGLDDAGALAYSIGLGQDNHMYFGGSSGCTCWGEYDPYKNTYKRHPVDVDPNQDYIKGIYGDIDYVYLMIGERDSISMWAVKKSDDSKRKLMSVVGTTIFTVNQMSDHNTYVWGGNWGTYKLKHGDTIRTSNRYGGIPAGLHRIAFHDGLQGDSMPYAVGHFNAGLGTYQYTISNGITGSIRINSNFLRTDIWRMFFDRTRKNGFYFIGKLYGTWYWYDLAKDSSYPVGFDGYNPYSIIQYSDTIFYAGHYPSGMLSKWNSKRSWQTATMVKDYYTNGSEWWTNPRILGYYRSTPAQFHHASFLEVTNDRSKIVAAGDVIRISKTCSIATYDINTGVFAGYDCKKIVRQSSSDMIKWKDLFLLSTNNAYGGTAKIYFYDPGKNEMTDSISYGFADYGKLYIINNLLVGVAKDRVYKIDLVTKKLLWTEVHQPGTIGNSLLLRNNTILINTFGNYNINCGFPEFINVPYNGLMYENRDTVYILYKQYILRYRYK